MLYILRERERERERERKEENARACVALVIILLSVVCSAVLHFSTLSHKRQDFGGKKIEHEMCILIFYTSFV